MTRPRDSQRAKLFKAERDLLFAHRPSATAKRKQKRPLTLFSFPPLSEDEAFAFAYATINSRWWTNNGGRNLRLAVVDWTTKYCTITRSGWKRGYDCLSLIDRNELFILHALAHTLHDEDTAWHGPEFARQYLRLVDRFVGEVAGKALRAEFAKQRVKARVLSHEAKLRRAVARTTKMVQDLQDQVQDLEKEDA